MKFNKNQGWMKLIVIFALVTVLGVMLCGCDKDQKDKTVTSQSETSWEDMITSSDSLLDRIPQGNELSGAWTGALVITDYKFPPVKKADKNDEMGAMDQAMQEGCQDVIKMLKGRAIPIQFTLNIGADGKGQMIIKDEDGEDQKPIPVQYTNGKLTVMVPPDESMPNGKVTMSAEVAAITNKYKEALKDQAAKQRSQVGPLKAELKAKQDKLSSASSKEKEDLMKDIDYLQKAIQFVEVGADYLDMIADSKATIRLNGNWEQFSAQDNYIKGVWTAVNTTIEQPKK